MILWKRVGGKRSKHSETKYKCLKKNHSSAKASLTVVLSEGKSSIEGITEIMHS